MVFKSFECWDIPHPCQLFLKKELSLFYVSCRNH